MSDPLLPPPRRPAPQDLRDRIAADLDRVSGRRFRLRYLAAPLAAAALVVVTVLGVSTLSGQRRAEPATPSPVATSTAATAGPNPFPTTRPTPTTTDKTPPVGPASVPAELRSLDVRALTTKEIARDSRSCSAPSQPGAARVPDPTARYARLQRRAGPDGPSTTEVRVLVDQDAQLTVACLNGSDPESGGGEADGLARPSRAVPAVEVADFGTVQGNCATRATSVVTTSELYAVADTVAAGRIRINRGATKGPWQLTTPLDGLVYFPVALTGDDAWTAPVSIDIQFLDRDGEQVTIQPYGSSGTGVTQTQTTQPETCSSRPGRTDEKITRPVDDAAGKTACLAMAADDDPEEVSFLDRLWTTELVVSTKDEWGAVLSSGKRRFGCSLYPTREVSRVVPDSTGLRTSSFYFALNPIAANDGVSLWASGRVPSDVTGISYALPGGRDVAAELNKDGYWMVKFHLDGADLAPGNVSGWDPVVVTVDRPGGPRTYRIPFSETSMCNQVSHGC